MRRLARAALAVVVLVALTAPAAAAVRRSLGPDIRIHRAPGKIRIDGRLNDPGWRGAVQVPLRWETFPGENTPARVKTTCMLTYDSSALYVACRAFDPRPSRIRAQFRERDRISPDDRINVTLDPSFAGRQAYGFGVNAVGSQMDYLLTHGGRSIDVSWDAIWESAGRIVKDGYVVEMAIPFRILTLPDKPSQTWGIVIARLYPRNVRYEFDSRPFSRSDSCSLCQLNRLVGLSGIRPGSNLVLSPSLTAERTDVRTDLPHGAWARGGVSSNLGFTTTWSPRSNARLAATINPDFSQVEIDLPQLEINRRFALFFPEKRPFFLAGSGYLDTPLQVVNTRAIADPAWGLKMTGKAGAWSGYAVAARDAITNLVIPGPEGSQTASLDGGNLSFALRLRRDVGVRSTIGAVLTGRTGKDGYSSSLIGVDGDFRFGISDEIIWQVLGSATRYPDWLAAEYNQPASSFHGHGATAEYRHKERDWLWSLGVDSRSRGLRADLGFLPQVGFRHGWGDLERRFWGASDRLVKFAAIDVSGSYSEEAGGTLLGRELSVSAEVQSVAQSFAKGTLTRRTDVFGGTAYDQSQVSLFLSMEPSRTLAFSVFVSRGDAIDYAHNAAGRSLAVNPRLRVRLARRLTGELRYWRQHFWRLHGTLYIAQLSDLRLNYFFDAKTSLRAVVQYRDTKRNPRYWTDVDSSSKRLFCRLLFVHRINAVSELYAGISQSQLGNSAFALTPANQTFFFKVRYAFLR